MASEHCTNGRPKFYATENVTKNYYMDDSQQIHKYDNVLIKKSNKKQTHVSPIRGNVGVYKVGTAGIKEF